MVRMVHIGDLGGIVAKYQMFTKNVPLRELNNKFTIVNGHIVSVVNTTYESDYSITMILLVELNDA
jgi:hypothetical protein